MFEGNQYTSISSMRKLEKMPWKHYNNQQQLKNVVGSKPVIFHRVVEV